jgi:hypothetical protein
LPSDPPVEFKRASTKSYPCPPGSIGKIAYLKIVTYIIEMSTADSASGFASSPHYVATFHRFGHPGFGGTDWMRKWRKNAVVGHKSHGPPPRPKQAYNKS